MKNRKTNPKRRKELDSLASYVRAGGHLSAFKPKDVRELQTFAREINDTILYDYLEKYWKGV